MGDALVLVLVIVAAAALALWVTRPQPFRYEHLARATPMLTAPDAYKPISRALLRAFDKTNPDIEGTIDTNNAILVANMVDALNDLNNGQYAATLDFLIQYGIDVFQASALRRFIIGGNFTKAVNELGPNTRGTRSAARRQAWNLGNSQ